MINSVCLTKRAEPSPAHRATHKRSEGVVSHPDTSTNKTPIQLDQENRFDCLEANGRLAGEPKQVANATAIWQRLVEALDSRYRRYCWRYIIHATRRV